ncbi:hypothetical protein BDN72DRAFT_896412 [Pluteus cervinus]|uniref:Uncharacterized protein n=1 Tax=Pluteus cervinus TaxID=181527 RepID=A0ACD3AY26_9AGAR|nr:hypothetical protein BDN72DRAFT_896412 [Pluteus cervinus]
MGDIISRFHLQPPQLLSLNLMPPKKNKTTPPAKKKKTTKYKRYYEKNGDLCRAKGRERMALVRARKKEALLNAADDDPICSRSTSPWTCSPPPSPPHALDVSWTQLPAHIPDPALFDYHPTLEELDGDDTPRSVQAFQDVINLCDDKDLHWSTFATFEKRVEDWLNEWGGLENWNSYMEEAWLEAREDNDALSAWGEMVAVHHQRGTELAQYLESLDGRLPREMWMIRHLWKCQAKVMMMLARGLAYIEVRLNLLNPGPFGLVFNVASQK